MHIVGFALLIYSLFILSWQLFALSIVIIEGGHVYNHIRGIEPYDFRPKVCFWRTFAFIVFTLAVFFCARMLEAPAGAPADATEGEIQMAEMMGITVQELRSQTPEEHMAMMMELAEAKKREDAKEEFFLPGKGLDINTLPEAKPSEIIQVEEGETITLDPTIVRKMIDGTEHIMYGYNGQIPGPTIIAKQGTTFYVLVENKIDMETTVHWHGLRHDYRFDGVPHISGGPIEPGDAFRYTIEVPDAGMFWYHPHVREDIQQDLGLYGALLVQPADDTWPVVDREEIVIVDDLFKDEEKGQIVPYGKKAENYSLMGRFGNTILTNGETFPGFIYVDSTDTIFRFYLINTSNTRTLNFSWRAKSNEDAAKPKMKIIGSDIGLYEKDTFADSVILAPAERAIVDVKFTDANTYELISSSPSNTYPLGKVEITEEIREKDWRIEEEEHPEISADILPFRDEFDRPVDKTLELTIELGGGMDHSGMHHDMQDGIEWEDTMAAMNELMTSDEVDWKFIDTETGKENMDIHWEFTKGDVRKVRIINNADSEHPMQHPVHFHGQRFLVLSMDGKKNDNLVWKDTVLIPAGSTTDLLFDMSNPGKWMFHCHIAEHLSNGMMGMFTVTEDE